MEGVEDSDKVEAKSSPTNLFPCHTCGFNAISLIKLITHKTSKHECVKYKCKYCVYTTNWSRSLRSHKLTRHKDKVCPKENQKKKDEENNIKVVKKQKRLRDHKFPRGKEHHVTCELCGKYFKLLPNRNNNKYLRHLATHKMKLKDCGCGIDFSSLNRKKRHIQLKHLGYLPCTKCKHTFAREESLKAHEINHNKKFHCEICTDIFSDEVKLNRHVQNMHDKKEIKESIIFKCELCEKTFYSDLRSKAHTMKVHNPRICPICGKTVKVLKSHLKKAHTDDSEKPFQCDKCGKGFCEKAHLRAHQMNVHLKMRPYKCRYGCADNVGYNDLSNRNSHERKKHGGVFQEIEKSLMHQI